MTFLIAATFTDALARLTGDEQKAVKTTAFDLQLNPANPGHQFHKLDQAKDKHFWSVRVGSDLRLIVHRTADSLLLCYVDHHDKAYAWAQRRKLATHPTTGAAQLVEVRETVQEVTRPVYIDAKKPVARQIPLFLKLLDADLLGYGVPPEWLDDVRRATDDTLLDLTDRLPGEAAEALLELATGGKPKPRTVALPRTTGSQTSDPFKHPDAQRRFRILGDVEELRRALDYPWDKWTVFLHPDQRQWVERTYSGPARVSGSAGTGKTIVALHRAVHLARRDPNARVLLTTFSDTLAHALRVRLRRLVGEDPRLGERVDVQSIQRVAARLYESQFGPAQVAEPGHVEALLKVVATETSLRVSPAFLRQEWHDVVDAWQVETWEAYRDVKRLGRKTRLPENQRAQLWSVFETVQERLRAKGLVSQAGMLHKLTQAMPTRRNPPYDHAVVDEAQDIGVAQLRFLAALGQGRPESLFFAGDLGQRIFQQPFSWRSLGVDIRGRSRTLHVNYRTSHQIRACADRLLGPSVSDVDENLEDRTGTVSVFNGPAPAIQTFPSASAEAKAVAEWLRSRVEEGVHPREVGIFVRSDAQLGRATDAVTQAGLGFQILDERTESTGDGATVATMHLGKGLEFRAVVVMACDDDVVPLAERIESLGDAADLQDVYDTERHLLYVACTRARDQLLVTSGGTPSEFLADLGWSPAAP
jgi:mRNA-degrading endonuclease RelE of RelBE toxin-antitoxin system